VRSGWSRINAKSWSHLPGPPVQPSVRAAVVAVGVDEECCGGRKLAGVLGFEEVEVCDPESRGCPPSF
jgi:hypothetical protein